MPDAPTFGPTVRDLRTVLGLTQKALAERLQAEDLHVTPAVVSRIERDRMGPALSRPLVDGLATVLGADAEALWASAQATARAGTAEPVPKKKARTPKPAGVDARTAFERGLRQWLASADYRVGLDAGAEDLDTKDFTDRVLGAVKLVTSAAVPMAITGGAGGDEVLAALAPFLADCDLLAYRVYMGSPHVLPVLFADDLGAEDLAARFARFRTLTQALVDFGAGFNGRGLRADVTPLLVYLTDEGYRREAEAALRVGFHAPTPKEAALGTDRTQLRAAAVHVPDGTVRWAEPAKPRSAFARGLESLVRGGMEAFGVRTDIFNETDLQTVKTLADHHARTGAA